MAIHMEYEGIKGSVTATGYEGMIDLRYCKFETYRAVSMKSGELANREYTKPTFGTMLIGKKLDAASAGLMREVFAGAAGKRVTLHFVHTGNNQLQDYMTLTFEQCLPNSFQLIGMGYDGGTPVERLCLSYTSVVVSYFDHGEDNKIRSVHRHGYDLVLAKNL